MPAMHAHARINRSVVVTLLAFGAGLAIFGCLHRYGLSWLAVDHTSVRQWVDGDGLYAYRPPDNRAGTGTDLSPLAALLLTPVALVPLPVAGWLLAVAGLAAL